MSDKFGFLTPDDRSQFPGVDDAQWQTMLANQEPERQKALSAAAPAQPFVVPPVDATRTPGVFDLPTAAPQKLPVHPEEQEIQSWKEPEPQQASPGLLGGSPDASGPLTPDQLAALPPVPKTPGDAARDRLAPLATATRGNIPSTAPKPAAGPSLNRAETAGAGALDSEIARTQAQLDVVTRGQQEQSNIVTRLNADLDRYATEGQDLQKQQAAAEEAGRKVWRDRQAEADAVRINPNQYYQSKSTGSKIALTIAAVLQAGASALMHRTDNPVVEGIDRAIEQDIKLQVMGKNDKQNAADRERQAQTEAKTTWNDKTLALAQRKRDATEGAIRQLQVAQQSTDNAAQKNTLSGAIDQLQVKKAGIEQGALDYAARKAAAQRTKALAEADKVQVEIGKDADGKPIYRSVSGSKLAEKTATSNIETSASVERETAKSRLDAATGKGGDQAAKNAAAKKEDQQSLLASLHRERIAAAEQYQRAGIGSAEKEQAAQSLRQTSEAIENLKSQISGGGTPREDSVKAAVESATPGFIGNLLGRGVAGARADAARDAKIYGGK